MERPSTKTTRWIQFIGGRNLIFTLIAGVLLGALIFIFYLVRFIFEPLGIILGTLFAPVLLALIFYYLLEPIVNYFEGKGVKRIYTIIGIGLVLVLLMVAFGIWAVPKLYSQTFSLITDFPQHVDNFNNMVQNFVAGTMFEEPAKEIFGSLEDVVGQVINVLSDSLGDIQQFVGDIFSTVSGFFVIMLTAPIITFFLLKDAKKFKHYFLKLLPPKFREDANELGGILDIQVGAIYCSSGQWCDCLYWFPDYWHALCFAIVIVGDDYFVYSLYWAFYCIYSLCSDSLIGVLPNAFGLDCCLDC